MLTVRKLESLKRKPPSTRKEFSDAGKGGVSIPGEKTKNRNLVPLSRPAVKLIAGQPKKGEYVFSVDGQVPVSGFWEAKRQLDKRIIELNGEALKPWTFHDLRRSAVTGLQSLGVPLEVSEAILNHKSGSISGVAAVYHRHDFLKEGRQALDKWAAHLEGIIRGTVSDGAEIVQLTAHVA